MKKEIKKLENSKVEALVSLDKEEWKKAQEKAFNELLKTFEMKGFRKGKVPAEMAKGKINDAEIFNKAIDMSLQGMYDEVLKDDVHPFARPQVDITKVSNEELEVKFIIIGRPEVTLGKYKGLHAEKDKVEVKDADVDAEIKKLQEQNASLVVVSRPAKLGDTVSLDFEGFVDGKAFEGGKAENYELELGSHSFIPGFEEQLVGAKADEAKDINVKFPKEYTPELASKDATFKVKVHEVKEKQLPKVNEELIADLNMPEVKDVESLKAFERKTLEEKAKQASDSKYYEAIVKQIRDDAKITLAPEIVADEVNAMKENLTERISQQGLTLESYLQITGQKMEDFEKKLQEDAITNIRSVLVLEKIAQIEKIEIDDAEVEFEIAKIADQYHMEVEKVKEILFKDKDRFIQEIRSRRLYDFLMKNND